MNFMNFLTSGASLFNFNLQQSDKNIKKQNLILVDSETAKEPQGRLSNQLDSTASMIQNQPQNKEELSKLLLAHESLLVSQFLQLNYLKSASGILAGQQPSESVIQDVQEKEKLSSSKSSIHKKIKKENKCGHDDRPHYAKGMCNNCYHKFGRTKKPWNCTHSKLYAAGMCQNCYINNYNRKRRQQKNDGNSQVEQMEEIIKNSEQLQ